MLLMHVETKKKIKLLSGQTMYYGPRCYKLHTGFHWSPENSSVIQMTQSQTQSNLMSLFANLKKGNETNSKERTKNNRIQLEGKWTDRKGLEERRKLV
jgi:hypothetical protein